MSAYALLIQVMHKSHIPLAIKPNIHNNLARYFNHNQEGTYMNRKELIDALADKTGSSKADADRNIGALIDIVTSALKKGDNVALVGFGTFEVRKRAARAGRNPATGAAIKIKASKVPAFKAGATLKAAVNGSKK
jgi:DNA-binding protein HU-beta